ncbi:hypothetical protein AGRA3207_003208 [Actinomadura graeca]|uniref:Uncharacterized protein n=1 Tax=Actinomadura graeca TaxID=2750812 RepID=A0ABX8QZM6_9ACTN|nr:hypothetical protein [Actinomadura graeca]QXJ22238.1 hypothetical protein AGRA3207_003208 [Actinomadura graeca]
MVAARSFAWALTVTACCAAAAAGVLVGVYGFCIFVEGTQPGLGFALIMGGVIAFASLVPTYFVNFRWQSAALMAWAARRGWRCFKGLGGVAELRTGGLFDIGRVTTRVLCVVKGSIDARPVTLVMGTQSSDTLILKAFTHVPASLSHVSITRTAQLTKRELRRQRRKYADTPIPLDLFRDLYDCDASFAPSADLRQAVLHHRLPFEWHVDGSGTLVVEAQVQPCRASRTRGRMLEQVAALSRMLGGRGGGVVPPRR